jgi:hypothetical protein
MQVTITDCKNAPHWQTLQTLLREALGDTATLTKIARQDGGVNYRAVGVYDLTLRIGSKPNVAYVPVTLTIA